jgi:uncharacterized protein YndB with AHSA1/START domain/predicted enzyme related to lactoylglutathione lyase
VIRTVDPLISLPATDPARAHAFYTETLGLRAVAAFPENHFYIYLAAEENDHFIGIHRHDGPLPPPEAQGIWLWLKVSDIDDARAALEAKGVRFLGEKCSIGPGLEQRFLDSEGNVLRLYAPIAEVRRSVEIAAPAERVFAALADAAAFERWFEGVSRVEIEPRAGGRVAFVDELFGEVTGRVTVMEPPARIAFELERNWPTHLEMSVTPLGDARVRVDVVQRGFEPIDDRDFGIPGLIEHLEAALAALRALCEAGAATAVTAMMLQDALGLGDAPSETKRR